MSVVPLMLAPLALYNVIAFGLFGQTTGEIWMYPIFTVEMLSGARWSMTLGDLMIVIGLVMLSAQIVNSARVSSSTLMDHVLSAAIFFAFLVEFIVVRQAAHSVFFILMMISLISLVAEFSVTFRAAMGEIAIDR